MNFFIAIMYTFLSSFLITAPATTVTELGDDFEYYCNTRYDFCVEYPDDIFVNRMTPTNSDGIYVSSVNNEISMSVYGEYDAFNSSIEEQNRFLLKSLNKPDNEIKDHITIFSEDGFVSTIQFENYMMEVRCEKVDNYFVTALIRVKDQNKNQFNDSRDMIKIKVIS